MFLNEDESELQKTKTSENFNSKISKKKNFISNDICDPDEINNFIRFDEVININTLGSQPVIMFKKVQRLYNPKDDITTKTKPTAKSHEKVLVNNFVKPNYIMDGGLQQKLNKLGKTLGISALVICVIIFAIGLLIKSKVMEKLILLMELIYMKYLI